MSTLGTTTSAGHNYILANLLKSIGARIDAYYWPINGHDDYKEINLTELLGITNLEMIAILETCECLDKVTKEVTKKGFEKLVNKVGKHLSAPYATIALGMMPGGIIPELVES